MRERARERMAAAPVLIGHGVTVYRDRIEKGGQSYPLDGVTARVEAGSDVQRRITATRLLAFGVFAAAIKKTTGGESYLTIEGPAFFWSERIDRKGRDEGVKFAAAVNSWARRVAPDR